MTLPWALGSMSLKYWEHVMEQVYNFNPYYLHISYILHTQKSSKKKHDNIMKFGLGIGECIKIFFWLGVLRPTCSTRPPPCPIHPNPK